MDLEIKFFGDLPVSQDLHGPFPGQDARGAEAFHVVRARGKLHFEDIEIHHFKLFPMGILESLHLGLPAKERRLPSLKLRLYSAARPCFLSLRPAAAECAATGAGAATPAPMPVGRASCRFQGMQKHREEGSRGNCLGKGQKRCFRRELPMRGSGMLNSMSEKLTKQDEALVEAAAQLIRKQVSVMSTVGCALLTTDGKMFVGVNVEQTHSSPCSMCAEYSAIGAMQTEDNFEIATILAVDDEGVILPPCGKCREMIRQFGNPFVILQQKNGDHFKVRLDTLIPFWESSSSFKEVA